MFSDTDQHPEEKDSREDKGKVYAERSADPTEPICGVTALGVEHSREEKDMVSLKG